MRILIAGESNPLGKAFAKLYKKQHELIALDPKKADFTDYAPVGAIFKAYRFDAVIYFAAEGRYGLKTRAGDINLFKNLQYAAVLHGVKKMITLIDADESVLFNALVPKLSEKDPIGTCLRFFGLFGQGFSPKTSFIMKMLSDANKKGAVTIEKDRAVSPVHSEDALKLLSAFVENDLPQGVYDVVPSAPAKLSQIARLAKKILGEVTVSVGQKNIPEADDTGNPATLVGVLPKFKFMPLAAAVGKVLGDV